MSNIQVNIFPTQFIDSRMYIIVFIDIAVIIDPNTDEEAFLFLEKRQITHCYIILTHEHYDHISGVNKFRERFNCTVICSKKCGENIKAAKKNLAAYFDVLLTCSNLKMPTGFLFEDYNYSCTADIVFQEKYILNLGSDELILTETPGHSEGSICIVMDNVILFSGDSLLNVPVITKLPGGSRKEYEQITLPYLRELSKSLIVYPGHGDIFPINSKI